MAVLVALLCAAFAAKSVDGAVLCSPNCILSDGNCNPICNYAYGYANGNCLNGYSSDCYGNTFNGYIIPSLLGSNNQYNSFYTNFNPSYPQSNNVYITKSRSPDFVSVYPQYPNTISGCYGTSCQSPILSIFPNQVSSGCLYNNQYYAIGQTCYFSGTGCTNICNNNNQWTIVSCGGSNNCNCAGCLSNQGCYYSNGYGSNGYNDCGSNGCNCNGNSDCGSNGCNCNGNSGCDPNGCNSNGNKEITITKTID